MFERLELKRKRGGKKSYQNKRNQELIQKYVYILNLIIVMNYHNL